jgi:exopolyphosphatase/guanosine-5'-triphosphate,3'-diphosphate pyrophosphatase
MRLGVLDVGSNTVHLLVVDARPGGRPLPAASHKSELHLAEHLGPSGDVTDGGVEALVTAVGDAMAAAADQGVEQVLPFVTSAVREAGNAEAVLAEVADRTGVSLHVLTGEREAALTFLAARRWYGWSAGRLVVLDIGGGSLEVAAGQDEAPAVALSTPLGAGRLTREAFAAAGRDVAADGEVAALRVRVRRDVAKLASELNRAGPWDRTVGTSKTFRSLARVAAHDADGRLTGEVGVLDRAALKAWVPRLAGMDAAGRAELQGVTLNRAPQLLAGALVAEALMDLLDVPTVAICPWALREGVLLHHFDALPDPRPQSAIVAVPPVPA